MSSKKIKVDGKLEYWSDRWTNQKTGWHQKTVDKFLLKYYKQVTGQSLPSDNEALPKETFKENASKTWFVPLCGKTLDIPFLLSLGYKVFAVEGVRQAIETLGSENNLELEWDETNNLFVGAEGRLKIYIGDLFQCPIEQFGPFDYVWDRGSLIAVEYDLRDAYKEMIQRALKDQNGKCKNPINHFNII
jgi:thiopurine S-methyltransferase